MLHTRDLASFVDRVEEHIRAVFDLFDGYLAAHPEAADRIPEENMVCLDAELGGIRKQLSLVDRVLLGQIELDISPEYLPADTPPDT